MKHLRTATGLLAIIAPFAVLMALVVSEPEPQPDPGFIIISHGQPPADSGFTFTVAGDLANADIPLLIRDEPGMDTLLTISGDGTITRNCPALASPDAHVGANTASLGIIAGARLACEKEPAK